LWRKRLVFWTGAIAVGVAAVAFAKAADAAQHLFGYALRSDWLVLLITPLGFGLLAWLARAYFPGSQGSGIPQAMAARQFPDGERRGRLLSMKVVAGKVALTLAGLACGASIGREGPTVQIGAAIMLLAADWGGMGRQKGLIIAGSAAGVAAAFNTPLAGIVFAIEEMSRAFEMRTSGLVLLTVILAGLASLGIVGNYSYFGSTPAMLHGAVDWLAVPVCGIAGGLLGGLFSKAVLRITRWLRARRGPGAGFPVGFAIACGLTVAVSIVASGGITFGTGYEQARFAVESGALPWYFTPLKLLATLASSVSGIPGGLFAPSLAVGAGLGSLIAAILHVRAVGAVVVLGMAGYFAGVVQAPITAFVIILEMTADQQMVTPLMCAAFIGFGVSRLISPQPLYHMLAHNFAADLRGPAGAPPVVEEGLDALPSALIEKHRGRL
jgi:H+/Cl- antiporter ClcA